MALKAPFAAQGVRKQGFASAAGFAVGAVVCAHDRFHLCLPDAGLERGKIGLGHILGCGFGVKSMTQPLRAAVDREMLGAGGGFHRPAASLKPVDIGLAEP